MAYQGNVIGCLLVCLGTNFIFFFVDYDYEEYVKRSLETLKLQIRELTTMVESISSSLKALRASRSLPIEVDIAGYTFPLRNISELWELEKQVKASTDKCQRLVKLKLYIDYSLIIINLFLNS